MTKQRGIRYSDCCSIYLLIFSNRLTLMITFHKTRYATLAATLLLVSACSDSNDPGTTSITNTTNTDLLTISVGERHACAIDNNQVRCRYNDDYGQADAPILTNPSEVDQGFRAGKIAQPRHRHWIIPAI